MLNAGFLTLPTLKARLMPSAQVLRSDYDDDLRSIGLGVAEAFNMQCNRELQRQEGATYEVDAERTSLCVHGSPIEQVKSVSIISGTESTDITAEILTIFNKSGIIEFGTVLGNYTQKVEVIYDGGYWLNDGTAMPTVATAMPADILDAFVHQCQAAAEARGTFHTGSLRRADTEDSGSSLKGLHLNEVVITTLKRYHRYV